MPDCICIRSSGLTTLHLDQSEAIRADSMSDRPVQLDMAADLTVVPLAIIEQLELIPHDSIPVLAFGGILRNVSTYLVS